MKIVHVINSLETGGAEMMLLKLLQSGIYENYNVLIIVLSKKNTLSENIKKLSINVEHLNFLACLRDLEVDGGLLRFKVILEIGMCGFPVEKNIFRRAFET